MPWRDHRYAPIPSEESKGGVDSAISCRKVAAVPRAGRRRKECEIHCCARKARTLGRIGLGIGLGGGDENHLPPFPRFILTVPRTVPRNGVSNLS